MLSDDDDTAVALRKKAREHIDRIISNENSENILLCQLMMKCKLNAYET